MSDFTCPYINCPKKEASFKGTRGLQAHLRQAHKNEPLPALARSKPLEQDRNVAPFQHQTQLPRSATDYDFDYDNDFGDFQSQGSASNSSGEQEVLPENLCYFEEDIWPPPNREKATVTNECRDKVLSGLERSIAQFAFDAGLSKDLYKR